MRSKIVAFIQCHKKPIFSLSHRSFAVSICIARVSIDFSRKISNIHNIRSLGIISECAVDDTHSIDNEREDKGP